MPPISECNVMIAFTVCSYYFGVRGFVLQKSKDITSCTYRLVVLKKEPHSQLNHLPSSTR